MNSAAQQYAVAINNQAGTDTAFQTHLEGLSLTSADPALIYLLHCQNTVSMDSYTLQATTLTEAGYTFALLNLENSVTFDLISVDGNTSVTQVVLNEPVTFLFDSLTTNVGWNIVQGLFPNGSLYTSVSFV